MATEHAKAHVTIKAGPFEQRVNHPQRSSVVLVTDRHGERQKFAAAETWRVDPDLTLRLFGSPDEKGNRHEVAVFHPAMWANAEHTQLLPMGPG